VIKDADKRGVAAIVDQQFEYSTPLDLQAHRVKRVLAHRRGRHAGAATVGLGRGQQLPVARSWSG
jgi:hypothetical protein